jgi:hypothetical protein
MRELVSDTERYGYSNEQIGMSVMLSMLFTLDKDKYTGPKARIDRSIAVAPRGGPQHPARARASTGCAANQAHTHMSAARTDRVLRSQVAVQMWEG